MEIKKSSILSGQLANLAHANGKKKCKVVLDCKWHWGYSLKMKMIRRYFDLKVANWIQLKSFKLQQRQDCKNLGICCKIVSI